MAMQSASFRPLDADLSRLWWLVLVRGLLMIAFGVLAVGFTRTAAEALITLLGIFLIVDGIVTLISTAIARRRLQRGNWLAGQAIFAIIVGVIVLLLPGLVTWTVFSLIIVWGVIAIGLLVGIAMLRFSFSVQRVGGRFGALGVSGAIISALAALQAVVTAINPSGVALGLLWLLGFGAILLGIVVIVWAFMLRRAMKNPVMIFPPQL